MWLWNESSDVLRESMLGGGIGSLIQVPVFLAPVALSNMAAGVGLYWGLSSVIGAVQGVVAQRQARTAA